MILYEQLEQQNIDDSQSATNINSALMSRRQSINRKFTISEQQNEEVKNVDGNNKSDDNMIIEKIRSTPDIKEITNTTINQESPSNIVNNKISPIANISPSRINIDSISSSKVKPPDQNSVHQGYSNRKNMEKLASKIKKLDDRLNKFNELYK